MRNMWSLDTLKNRLDDFSQDLSPGALYIGHFLQPCKTANLPNAASSFGILSKVKKVYCSMNFRSSLSIFVSVCWYVALALAQNNGFYEDSACSCSYFPPTGTKCVRPSTTPGLCVNDPCKGGYKCKQWISCAIVNRDQYNSSFAQPVFHFSVIKQKNLTRSVFLFVHFWNWSGDLQGDESCSRKACDRWIVASPGLDISGEFPCALGPTECTSLSDASITPRAPVASPGVCIYTDIECGCSAKTDSDDDTCIHVDSRISDITGICSMGECRKSRFVCDCLAPTHVCKRRPCMRWEPKNDKGLEYSFECNRVNAECVIKEDVSPRMAPPISPRTATIPPPTTSTPQTTKTTPRLSTTTTITTVTTTRPPTTVHPPTTTHTTTPIPTTTSTTTTTTTTKQMSTFKFLFHFLLPILFFYQVKSDFYGGISFFTT